MTQPALPFRPVVRVYFFCCECPYPTPAAWRIDYEDGSFWTICNGHYHMLTRHFPAVEARSRALLPDEAPGPDLAPFHASKARGNVIIGGKSHVPG